MKKFYTGKFRVDPGKLLAAIAHMGDEAAGAYFRRLLVLLVEQRYGICRQADELLEQAENLSRIGRQNVRRRWAKCTEALPPHEAETRPEPVPEVPVPTADYEPVPSNLAPVARVQSLADLAVDYCGFAGSQLTVERFQKAIDHIGEGAFRSMLDETKRECGDGAANGQRAAALVGRLRAARAAGWR